MAKTTRDLTCRPPTRRRMSYDDDLLPGSLCEAPPGVGGHGARSSQSAETETGPSTRAEEDGIDGDSRDSLLVPEDLLCPSPAQAHDQHQDSLGIKHTSLKGDHMTKTAFSALLDWIYKGEGKMKAEHLFDVIMCACYLQMDVVVFLENYLHSNLYASIRGEIMTVLRTAKKYDIKHVYETCVNHLVSHFKEFSGIEEFPVRRLRYTLLSEEFRAWSLRDVDTLLSEEFKLLDVDTLIRLLQDLKIRDEDLVFQMALSWLRYSESNRAHTGDVIKSCRLGLVDNRLLNDGLEVAFLSRNLDAGIVLRQAMNTELGSLDSRRTYQKTTCRSRTTRNEAFYVRRMDITEIGDTYDSGHLMAPRAACVLGGIVLVADWGSHRLVAFHVDYHSYVCHLKIDRPWRCVSDQNTDTVYVHGWLGNKITILKLTQSKDLYVVRKLTAGGKLAALSHMALNPRDREHIYVACVDGVHKVSLTTDTVVTTLIRPSGVTCRPEWVAIIGSTIMVTYRDDNTLVLYIEGDTSGHMIRPSGLKKPSGLGEDGVNFLVGDKVDRCIYVISPSGETLTTVNTRRIVPFHITVDRDTVYFTSDPGDGYVHILQ